MLLPWVAIQRNPTSGAGRRSQPIRELIRQLKLRGITPRLYSRRADFDAAVTDPERRPHLRAIVAAGGDGTMLDLVNRHPQLPICLLPLGTENLLAKYLRVPSCGKTVAEMIARGNRRRLDLGRLNGRLFLIMTSVGFDAEIIHAVHAGRKGGHVRHTSYIGPLLKSLWRFRPETLRVTVDDSPQVYEGQLLVVANLPSYALNLGVVPTANGIDGLLHARLLTTGTVPGLIRSVLRILSGSHEQSPSVVRLVGRQFRIESDAPVPIQADGDPAGMTPATMSVDPLAVEFIVP